MCCGSSEASHTARRMTWEALLAPQHHRCPTHQQPMLNSTWKVIGQCLIAGRAGRDVKTQRDSCLVGTRHLSTGFSYPRAGQDPSVPPGDSKDTSVPWCTPELNNGSPQAALVSRVAPRGVAHSSAAARWLHAAKCPLHKTWARQS